MNHVLATGTSIVGVLVHGGPAARRSAIVAALRARYPDMLVRISTRTAEAAKCLADPVVQLVVVIDEPKSATSGDDTVAQHVTALVATLSHPVSVCTIPHDDAMEDVALRIERELVALSRP